MFPSVLSFIHEFDLIEKMILFQSKFTNNGKKMKQTDDFKKQHTSILRGKQAKKQKLEYNLGYFKCLTIPLEY